MLTETLGAALAVSLVSADHYCRLFLAYLAVLRRWVVLCGNASTDRGAAAAPPMDAALLKWREAVQSCAAFMQQYFPVWDEGSAALLRMAAATEVDVFQDIPYARQLWEALVTCQPSLHALWAGYIAMERSSVHCGYTPGDNVSRAAFVSSSDMAEFNNRCRALYRRSISAIQDDPEAGYAAWVSFEVERGTVPSWRTATRACDAEREGRVVALANLKKEQEQARIKKLFDAAVAKQKERTKTSLNHAPTADDADVDEEVDAGGDGGGDGGDDGEGGGSGATGDGDADGGEAEKGGKKKRPRRQDEQQEAGHREEREVGVQEKDGAAAGMGSAKGNEVEVMAPAEKPQKRQRTDDAKASDGGTGGGEGGESKGNSNGAGGVGGVGGTGVDAAVAGANAVSTISAVSGDCEGGDAVVHVSNLPFSVTDEELLLWVSTGLAETAAGDTGDDGEGATDTAGAGGGNKSATGAVGVQRLCELAARTAVQVVSIHLVRNRRGKPKGFGFVALKHGGPPPKGVRNFDASASAGEAGMALNGRDYNGRALRISLSTLTMAQAMIPGAGGGARRTKEARVGREGRAVRAAKVGRAAREGRGVKGMVPATTLVRQQRPTLTILTCRASRWQGEIVPRGSHSCLAR